MDYNVENWLRERGYKTVSNEKGLSVTDGRGKTYALDTSGFTADGGTYMGSGDTIRTTLAKSGAGGPAGYTPLRNTLSGAGASVGYDATADAPIVNGQMLNKNDSRLIKVGDDYWIDEAYAKEFVPKEYENPYKEEMNSILSALTDMQFSYDPAKDTALRAAQDEAMLAAKQSANARGLLGGSTAEIMRQRAAQALVPEYEKLAYSRFADDRNAKMEMVSILGTLAENAFKEYAGEAELALQNRKYAQDAQVAADNRAKTAQEAALSREKLEREDAFAREELEKNTAVKTFSNQLDKVIAMGVVDEEAAAVLGLPAGTLTREQWQFVTKLAEAAEAEKRAAAEKEQERADALAEEEREWERKKDLLKFQTDEKIRLEKEK